MCSDIGKKHDFDMQQTIYVLKFLISHCEVGTPKVETLSNIWIDK